MASQVIVKGKKLEGKGGKRKVVGWSTKGMDEKVSKLRVEDTEEMVSGRSLRQEEIEDRKRRSLLRKRCALGVENGSKKQEISASKMGEDCWARIFLMVQRVQSAPKARHAGKFDGGGRDEAAAKNENYGGYDNEKQSKRKNGCQRSVNYWLPTAKKRGSIRDGRILCRKCYDWLCDLKKKDEVNKMEEEHQRKISQTIKSADERAGSQRRQRGEEECRPWRRKNMVRSR